MREDTILKEVDPCSEEPQYGLCRTVDRGELKAKSSHAIMGMEGNPWNGIDIGLSIPDGESRLISSLSHALFNFLVTRPEGIGYEGNVSAQQVF